MAAEAGQLLARAQGRRRALGLPAEGTTAYRLLHGAGDGAPGVFVDVYGEWLVAEVYVDEGGGAWERGWLDALAALPYRGVYLKRRPREAGRLGPAARLHRAPSRAVRGDDAPTPLVVREAGVPFEVTLGDGLATGIYLDQRDNRARVRAAAAGGARVLNLFAYTCTFGAVAALGGAGQTCNVDISKGALEWGKRNYALAGLALAAHRFYARDVFDFLRAQARRGERYDLVVLDPPSFARSKGRTLRVDRDYPRLAEQAAALLAPGGQLLACCNRRDLSERQFALWLTRAWGTNATWRRLAPPADFPVGEGESPHLKSAWKRS